jgi:hypothetical protein
MVVTSPGEPWEAGPSAAELAAALRRWPGITDLTLLGVCNAASTLAPLATASLKRLTSLTLRAFEVGLHGHGSPCKRHHASAPCMLRLFVWGQFFKDSALLPHA